MSDEETKKFREDQAKMNEEVMAKQAKYRPTPTVEEIQRALDGQGVDDKEPDGSAEQNVHHHTVPISAQIEVGHKTEPTKSDEHVKVAASKPAASKTGPA